MLTFCLILFKRKEQTFKNLPDLYTAIVSIYREEWEQPKRHTRLSNPIEWDILENTLSYVAFKMIEESIGYTIARPALLKFLEEFIDELRQHHYWSNQHTVYDLLEQLCSHNFLKSYDDHLTFWHATIRDYFATLYCLQLPVVDIVKLIHSVEWELVVTFLCGIPKYKTAIRDELVDLAVQSIEPENVQWIIHLLNKVGDSTTPDLLRIASQCRFFPEINRQLWDILEQRDFPGKRIFRNVFQPTLYWDGYATGQYSLEALRDYLPPLDSIDFRYYDDCFENCLLHLADGKINEAEEHGYALLNYLDSLMPLSTQELDPWLQELGVKNIADFQSWLLRNKNELQQLEKFCRNTTLVTSMTFLAEIRAIVEDRRIRLLAQIAIHTLGSMHLVGTTRAAKLTHKQSSVVDDLQLPLPLDFDNC